MNDEYESTPIELTTDPLTTVRVVLSDGYSISGDFLSAVQAQVCEALPYLEPGSTYTADEWQRLRIGVPDIFTGQDHQTASNETRDAALPTSWPKAPCH